MTAMTAKMSSMMSDCSSFAFDFCTCTAAAFSTETNIAF